MPLLYGSPEETAVAAGPGTGELSDSCALVVAVQPAAASMPPRNAGLPPPAMETRGLDLSPEDRLSLMGRLRDRPAEHRTWTDIQLLAELEPEEALGSRESTMKAARDELRSRHRSAALKASAEP